MTFLLHMLYCTNWFFCLHLDLENLLINMKCYSVSVITGVWKTIPNLVVWNNHLSLWSEVLWPRDLDGAQRGRLVSARRCLEPQLGGLKGWGWLDGQALTHLEAPSLNVSMVIQRKTKTGNHCANNMTSPCGLASQHGRCRVVRLMSWLRLYA